MPPVGEWQLDFHMPVAEGDDPRHHTWTSKNLPDTYFYVVVLGIDPHTYKFRLETDEKRTEWMNYWEMSTYLDNNKTRQTKYSVSAYPSSSEVEDGEKALIQQPWTGSGGQKVEGAIDGMHQALRAITNERETVVAEQHQASSSLASAEKEGKNTSPASAAEKGKGKVGAVATEPKIISFANANTSTGSSANPSLTCIRMKGRSELAASPTVPTHASPKIVSTKKSSSAYSLVDVSGDESDSDDCAWPTDTMPDMASKKPDTEGVSAGKAAEPSTGTTAPAILTGPGTTKQSGAGLLDVGQLKDLERIVSEAVKSAPAGPEEDDIHQRILSMLSSLPPPAQPICAKPRQAPLQSEASKPPEGPASVRHLDALAALNPPGIPSPVSAPAAVTSAPKPNTATARLTQGPCSSPPKSSIQGSFTAPSAGPISFALSKPITAGQPEPSTAAPRTLRTDSKHTTRPLAAAPTSPAIPPIVPCFERDRSIVIPNDCLVFGQRLGPIITVDKASGNEPNGSLRLMFRLTHVDEADIRARIWEAWGPEWSDADRATIYVSERKDGVCTCEMSQTLAAWAGHHNLQNTMGRLLTPYQALSKRFNSRDDLHIMLVKKATVATAAAAFPPSVSGLYAQASRRPGQTLCFDRDRTVTRPFGPISFGGPSGPVMAPVVTIDKPSDLQGATAAERMPLIYTAEAVIGSVREDSVRARIYDAWGDEWSDGDKTSLEVFEKVCGQCRCEATVPFAEWTAKVHHRTIVSVHMRIVKKASGPSPSTASAGPSTQNDTADAAPTAEPAPTSVKRGSIGLRPADVFISACPSPTLEQSFSVPIPIADPMTPSASSINLPAGVLSPNSQQELLGRYLADLAASPLNTSASLRVLDMLKDEDVRLDSSLGLKLLELAKSLRVDGDLAPGRKGKGKESAVPAKKVDKTEAMLRKVLEKLNDHSGMLNAIAEASGVNLLDDDEAVLVEAPVAEPIPEQSTTSGATPHPPSTQVDCTIQTISPVPATHVSVDLTSQLAEVTASLARLTPKVADTASVLSASLVYPPAGTSVAELVTRLMEGSTSAGSAGPAASHADSAPRPLPSTDGNPSSLDNASTGATSGSETANSSPAATRSTTPRNPFADPPRFGHSYHPYRPDQPPSSFADRELPRISPRHQAFARYATSQPAFPSDAARQRHSWAPGSAARHGSRELWSGVDAYASPPPFMFAHPPNHPLYPHGMFGMSGSTYSGFRSSRDAPYGYNPMMLHQQNEMLLNRLQSERVSAGFGGPYGFGQSAPSHSGGLFGSAQPAAASRPSFGQGPAQTGGLFGSAAASVPSSGGGLFGQSTVPAPPASAGGGGLFGATAGPSQRPSGGLFGQSPAPARTPATEGGLFPASAAPSQRFSGGIFGDPSMALQPPPPSGGLFGFSSVPTSTPVAGQPPPAQSEAPIGGPAPTPTGGSSVPTGDGGECKTQ